MADKPVAEVVNVDAVIDALSPSPTSSDVYEATLPFNPHAVAASAVRRAGEGGGGGGGGIEVIGPFAVNWDTPNVNSGYIELPGSDMVAGTVIVRAWAHPTVSWATDPATSNHQVFISRGPDTGFLTAYALTSIARGTPQIAGNEVEANQTSATDLLPYAVAIVPDGGSELYVEIYAEANEFVAGSLDIYALIIPPS